VEFSPELCEIARENAKTFKRKARTDAQIQVVEADVARYPIEPESNVFFMFNPFDEFVMTQFLTILRNSLIQVPRKIWFVYNTPEQAEAVEKSRLFCSCRKFKINEVTFLVYHNWPDMKVAELRTVAHRTVRQVDPE
jgi:hypothetical protein